MNDQVDGTLEEGNGMDEELDAAAYESLVEGLARDARDGRSADDPVWDAVGDVVADLTPPVCRRVLEHAANEPQDDVVAEVTEVRESDDAERLRARALTVLVADVRDRVDAVASDATR